MVSTIIGTRLIDYIMMSIMVAGSIFACMIGFTVMNMAFGVTNMELMVNNSDPDYVIYKNNPAHWSEEINYYGERLNQTMYPICCHQYGEGQVWGDERK